MIYLKYSSIFTRSDVVNMAKQRRLLQIFSTAILIVAVMALAFSVGCDNQPEEISVELGEEL
jgi:hypothetical protein